MRNTMWRAGNQTHELERAHPLRRMAQSNGQCSTMRNMRVEKAAT